MGVDNNLSSSDLLEDLRTYENLVNLSMDIICSIDEEGQFLKVNAATHNILGYLPGEMLKRSLFELVYEEDLSTTIAIYKNIRKQDGVHSFQNRLICKDGSLIWLYWSIRKDHINQIVYCVGKDISERNQNRQTFLLQEDRLKRTCELARLGLWEMDLVNNRFYSSDALFELYGLKRNGRTFVPIDEFFTLVHPDDVSLVRESFLQIKDFPARTLKHRIIKPGTGEMIYILQELRAVLDGDHVVGIHGTTKDITEIENAQTALEQSEKDLKISNERFEFVSQATSDAIWDCDIVNKTTYYNYAFTKIFGHPNFVQQSADIWEKNIHPEDLERVLEEVDTALNDTAVSILNINYRFVRANGSYAYVHDRAIIIRDLEKKAIRMVGAMQDVTKQKEAELLLEKNEKRFRAMVQSGQDLVALFDTAFRIQYISPNSYLITGNYIEELVGRRGHSFLHREDYDRVMQEASKIYTQKTVHLTPHRFKAKDGSYKWFETTLTNFLDDEDINAIICNTRDITKRKAALDEVTKLSTIVQQTANGVILTDHKGIIQWVNEAFTKRSEYTFEEAIGKNPINFLVGPETCENTIGYMLQRIKRKQTFHCELVNYSRSGRKYWVEINGKAICEQNGAVKHWFFIQTDITGRKEAEEALRLSEEKYKLLFYKSPSPKWIFNAITYQIVEANEAASGLYGYSRDEFLGMTIPDLKVDEDKLNFDSIVQNALRQVEQTYYKVVWHQKKNGELLQVEVNAHAFELPSGKHFILTAYDISERLALQTKIMEEKVAAQKEITKAIINTQEKERSLISKELHDNVNQILTAAKLCIENIRYFPEQREMFTDKGVGMVQNAISEIRSLSKTLVLPAVYESGLKVTTLEMLDQYRNLKRFELIDHLEFDEQVIDKELKLTIYRIIQELMNNTVKYAQATSVNVFMIQKENGLTVSVNDNGIGFNPNTKRNGMGLANIKSRVELFHGKLNIVAAPGRGCKTVAVFPI